MGVREVVAVIEDTRNGIELTKVERKARIMCHEVEM